MSSPHFYWAAAVSVVAFCTACATCQYSDNTMRAEKYSACMRELKSAETCGVP